MTRKSVRKCLMCRAPGVVRKNEPVTVTLEDGKTVRLSAVTHDFCPHCVCVETERFCVGEEGHVRLF